MAKIYQGTIYDDRPEKPQLEIHQGSPSITDEEIMAAVKTLLNGKH